ncbi:MAG: isopenicillin N synthase family oxygenase [Aureispira sp.]|nr:isopenicillin N synthase family oxygenase [Aureispira sp.]
MTTITGIPVVDLSQFTKGDATQQAEFVQQLGQAFTDIGFVSVINHGIPMEKVNAFSAAAEKFFALDKATKVKYEVPGGAGQRGYTSFGKEHAKQSDFGDLKEFFQIGQEVPEGHALENAYPNNMYTTDYPTFSDLGNQLYREFEKAGSALLEAIALFLGLDREYFNKHIEYGNSILRAIHYPPITEEPQSAIRAEEHEDINLITLLFGASAGGLQVRPLGHDWIPVKALGDAFVINVGDMLQRLTNNRLKSTTHRVVNPPREKWGTPRYSIPFFLHPRADMDLTCLDSCVTEERPLNYEPIKAGEYLDERLMEIGLLKK